MKLHELRAVQKVQPKLLKERAEVLLPARARLPAEV